MVYDVCGKGRVVVAHGVWGDLAGSIKGAPGRVCHGAWDDESREGLCPVVFVAASPNTRCGLWFVMAVCGGQHGGNGGNDSYIMWTVQSTNVIQHGQW